MGNKRFLTLSLSKGEPGIIMIQPSIQIFPLPGLPEIKPGDDLAQAIAQAVRARDFHPANGDCLVIAQKVVSKAEGRVVRLDSIVPSTRAVTWARDWHKDPRVIELVLRESRRIVRMERGVIVAETKHGFVCANAGVDLSNAVDGTAILLPEDPNASARALQERLAADFAVDIGVII